MAKRDFSKNYKGQSDQYREKFSRDEFRGQKATTARKRAMEAGKKEQGGSLTAKQRQDIRSKTPVSTMGGPGGEGKQFYVENKQGKRKLQDMSADNSPFGVDKLEDFDLAAYGAGSQRNKEVLNVNDVRGLMNTGGFTAEQISKYSKNLGEGARVSGKAQQFLDKKLANVKGKPKTDGQIDNNTQTPSTTITQEQSFDREFGDNQNTIGNENVFYGNVNQGNQDFSVNIGSQGAGGESGGGTSLNNMQSAVGYNALNENQYERSNAKFNPYGRAQANIDQTKKSVNIAEGNRATNELYGGLRNLYRAQTTDYMTNLFGDYFNQPGYKPPKWNAPAAPSKISPEYEDD